MRPQRDADFMQDELAGKRGSARGARPLLYQTWRDVLFLHWDYPAERIQRSLPSGLSVDTFEGRAYMAVVPFRMESLRLRGLPAFPGISNFFELNLRTYVRDEWGRSGVWFYSLEADSRISVWIANRFFHLPYRYSKQRGEKTKGRLRFEARAERDPEQELMEFEVAPTGEPRTAKTGSLEAFLVERYRLFARDERTGVLYTGKIEHAPYCLRNVSVSKYSVRLFALNELENPASCEPCSALLSEGTEVSLFGLERLGA